MAGVRVIAVLAVSCRASDAQPAGPPIPASWRALPELAAAVAIDGARAWGDPARGCYAIDFALAGIDRDDAIASVRAAGFTIDDTGAFARGAYHGRARIAPDGVLACFWNEREPDACARACAEVAP